MAEFEIPQTDAERRLEKIDTLLNGGLRCDLENGALLKVGDVYHMILVSRALTTVGVIVINGDGTIGGHGWVKRKWTPRIPMEIEHARTCVDRYLG